MAFSVATCTAEYEGPTLTIGYHPWWERRYTKEALFEARFQALREKAGIKPYVPWWKRLFR